MKIEKFKIENYMRRAKFVASILQICPFVRAVFLTGSLARGEAKEKSDIDFFIVTKKGRIWTCRLFVTILVSMTGYRRHKDKISGRICLNRYQTEDNLDIKPHNSYHAFDYSKIRPLWETNGIYSSYLKENRWIKQKFGFSMKARRYCSTSWRTINFSITRRITLLDYARRIGERIFGSNWLENKLKQYQSQRILSDARTLNSPKGKVFISDKELRFHPEKNLDK